MDRKELLNFIYKLIEEIKDQQVLKTLITRDEIAMLLSFYHELVNNTPLNEQKEGKEEVLDKSNEIILKNEIVADFSKYALDTHLMPLESYINIIGGNMVYLKRYNPSKRGLFYHKVIKDHINNTQYALDGMKLLEGIKDEKEDKDSIV